MLSGIALGWQCHGGYCKVTNVNMKYSCVVTHGLYWGRVLQGVVIQSDWRAEKAVIVPPSAVTSSPAYILKFTGRLLT